MLNTFQNKQHTYYHWFPLFSFSILYKSKKYYSMYSWLFSKSITILVNEMCSCLRQYWIVNSNSFISHLLGCKQFYSKVQGFFADQLEVALPLHLCLGPFTPTCYKRWRCWTWTRAPTWSIFHIFFPLPSLWLLLTTHHSCEPECVV